MKHRRSMKFYILRSWTAGYADGVSGSTMQPIRGDCPSKWSDCMGKAYRDGYQEGRAAHELSGEAWATYEREVLAS